MAAYQRTKYIVDRKLQMRFTMFMLVFVFVSCSLTGLTIFYTITTILGERLAGVYPQARLIQIFRSAHTAFIIDLLVILPIIFISSILFSHRFAGPLPKIYQALRSIGDGNYEVRLILRKNDELRELTDTINEMARKLKERESRRSG